MQYVIHEGDNSWIQLKAPGLLVVSQHLARLQGESWAVPNSGDELPILSPNGKLSDG